MYVLTKDTCNRKHSSFSKLQSTKKRIRRLCTKNTSTKFGFMYLFMYLYSKDSSMSFSEKGVQLLEELVINFMPVISDRSESNHRTIALILLILFEIFFSDIKRLNNDKKMYSRTLTNLGEWSTNSRHQWFKEYEEYAKYQEQSLFICQKNQRYQETFLRWTRGIGREQTTYFFQLLFKVFPSHYTLGKSATVDWCCSGINALLTMSIN